MSKSKRNQTAQNGATEANVKIEDRHILPVLLIQRTEEEVAKQYSDNALDRENEKIQLLNGVETSWKELKEAHLKLKRYISEKIRDWEPTFGEELYRQWRKLNGWNMNSKSRPMIFAAYTVRDIYGSLPKEIYETLEPINEFLYPGVRKYRYCRLVTEECHEQVREIIKSAIGFATSSNEWGTSLRILIA